MNKEFSFVIGGIVLFGFLLNVGFNSDMNFALNFMMGLTLTGLTVGISYMIYRWIDSKREQKKAALA